MDSDDFIECKTQKITQCNCNHNKCKCDIEQEATESIKRLKAYLNIEDEELTDQSDESLKSVMDGESIDQEGDELTDVDADFSFISNKCQNQIRKKKRHKKQAKSRRKRIGSHFVKCRKYYKYRTMVRDKEFNYLQRYGKLWQQYIVDNWAKVDDNDLNYIQDNQKTIRRAHAKGLQDAIESDAIQSVGVPTILPRSHNGSPRWFHDKFQDAMTIIQAYKKPDLFITFTCNPKWKEITDNLFENQTAYDRPELVARVFNLKKQELLEDLLKNGIFGKVIGNVQVVEFQKRGLPHIHILIILDKSDSLKNCDEYDRIVSAEIPDPDKYPVLHDRVMSHMIHFHTKQCWVDNTCNKYFPKDYAERTTTQEDGYPVYRRRSPENVCVSSLLFYTNVNHIVYIV